MFEILAHGGLGRRGLWTRGGRELATPLLLGVPMAGRPAPAFTEALLVRDRSDDPRLQLRLGGSFFAPRARENPDDLPPRKGVPRSLADLDIPLQTDATDLAIVSDLEDFEDAKSSEVLFLANGPEYERSPRDFVAAVRRIRGGLGPSKVLGLTGLATPANAALLVYAGCDLIDSSRVVLDGVRGLFHTADESVPIREADREACGCEACVAGSDLVAHNERALFREVLLVRNHLTHGRLRELVERRLANAPWNAAVLRHLDLRAYDLVEPSVPLSGPALRAYSHESLTRPEVLRFRRRVQERYGKPASSRVLLLLPCAARKPYSASRSHRRFRDAILASRNPSVVHEVIVTSPLGLVPRELERFYPARAYDIPVTGDWNRDEAAVVSEDLRVYLHANRYDAIVAHLGAEAPFVKAAVPEAILTSTDKPTSDESLGSLTRALDGVAADLDRVPSGVRFSEAMGSIARFQFGEKGLPLVEAATFRGRFPDVRILRAGVQLGMHTARGMVSLTLAGGDVLSKHDAYWVEIEDFLPKGNVFAVGVVDAAPEVRPGDEVVVRHAGQVRVVGTARLSGREMVDLRRGEAVHVRHVAAAAP